LIFKKAIFLFEKTILFLKIAVIVGREDNDKETMFTIYNWIYHISGQSCGVEFILKEPVYFTKILCELVKNATLQIFFHKTIMALENLLLLKNPAIQEMFRSELSECVPNMTKIHFPPDLKERWEYVQKNVLIFLKIIKIDGKKDIIFIY
jgi:hypothetical protein